MEKYSKNVNFLKPRSKIDYRMIGLNVWVTSVDLQRSATMVLRYSVHMFNENNNCFLFLLL